MFIRGLPLRVKGNRRDRIVIFSALLACAIGGTKKTEMMYRAGLSTAQLRKYMEVLMKSELLEVLRQKKAVVYRTTVKGKRFLEEFDVLVRLLN